MSNGYFPQNQQPYQPVPGYQQVPQGYYPQQMLPPQPIMKVTRALEYPHFEDLEDFYPLPDTNVLLKRFLLVSFVFPVINLLLALFYFIIVFLIAPTSDTSGFSAYMSAIEQLALILILGPMVGIILSIGAIKLSNIEQSKNFLTTSVGSLILNIVTPLLVLFLLQLFTALKG